MLADSPKRNFVLDNQYAICFLPFAIVPPPRGPHLNVLYYLPLTHT